MADLLTIVRQEVQKYGRSGIGVRFFPIFDEQRQTYAINAIDQPQRQHPMGVVVMARVVDDKVIIEEDHTDHPLVEVLVQAGIPRDQIILAYAGENSAE